VAAGGNRSIPDTNVVIRYLMRDNPEAFAEAEKYFERVRTGAEKALVTEGVLAECAYVLTKYYGVPKADAVRALVGLLHYKGIANEDRAELIEGLELFAVKKLDLVDCLVLAKVKRGGFRLVTFDKAMSRIAASFERGESG
jgi:predicted nucleic-acid-binding protein